MSSKNLIVENVQSITLSGAAPTKTIDLANLKTSPALCRKKVWAGILAQMTTVDIYDVFLVGKLNHSEVYRNQIHHNNGSGILSGGQNSWIKNFAFPIVSDGAGGNVASLDLSSPDVFIWNGNDGLPRGLFCYTLNIAADEFYLQFVKNGAINSTTFDTVLIIESSNE